ncbi:RDD family protein [Tomitella biformata]|uniref:RDD family protein n=1 Tax=Tomitella biformata TaxID=630403 RepID=UPI000465AF70|nr:RDD family protein [Tomitella biformata]
MTTHDAPPTGSAGIVTRLLAAGIDLLVVCLLMGGIYLGRVFFRLMFAPQDFTFPSPHALLSSVSFLTLSVVYLTGCWGMTGRTIGSVLMGIRVEKSTPSKLRWIIAFGRAWLCVIFPVGLLWAVVDRQRRSGHDIVFRTRVVYDWQPKHIT